MEADVHLVCNGPIAKARCNDADDGIVATAGNRAVVMPSCLQHRGGSDPAARCRSAISLHSSTSILPYSFLLVIVDPEELHTRVCICQSHVVLALTVEIGRAHV